MMAYHLYNEMLDICGLNMKQVAMISFCKQMALSLSYKDGDPKKLDKLTKREREMAVEEVPDLLTYFSYMINPATATTGPFHEFAPFKDFINKQGRFADLKMFETWPAAFKRFFHAYLCLGVMLAFPVITGVGGRD